MGEVDTGDAADDSRLQWCFAAHCQLGGACFFERFAQAIGAATRFWPGQWEEPVQVRVLEANREPA